MADESWQSAWVEVLPDFKEFRAKSNKEMTSVLSTAGDRGGQAAKSGIGAGIIGGITGALALGAAAAAADIGRAIGNTIGEGINFALDGVDLASDLEETRAAIGQVFGEAAKDVESFAKDANAALGSTQQEALAGAQTFGIFGKSAELQGAELASFSTDLLTLATDLGSFNNTSTPEAIQAIGAALRGESEPIRAYGVLLDDATLRQEALKLGLIATTKQALTPQQRILAANAAIWAQTTDQQGDFARTSDGLANQNKILAASFKEAQTALGEDLLPSMTTLTTLANEKLIPVLNELVDEVGPILADALAKSAPAFGDLVEAIAPLLPDLVTASVELLPLFIDALILLAPLLIDAAKNSAAMAAGIGGILDLLSGDVTLAEYIADIRGIGGSVQATGDAIGTFIGNMIAGMRSFAYETGVNVSKVVAFFTNLPNEIVAAVGNMGDTLFTAGQDLIGGLINGATSILRTIATTFANVLPEGLRAPFLNAIGVSGAPSRVLGSGVSVPRVGGAGAAAGSVAAGGARGAGTGGVAPVLNVYPSPGMDERTIGRVAANEMAWQIRSAS